MAMLADWSVVGLVGAEGYQQSTNLTLSLALILPGLVNLRYKTHPD